MSGNTICDTDTQKLSDKGLSELQQVLELATKVDINVLEQSSTSKISIVDKSNNFDQNADNSFVSECRETIVASNNLGDDAEQLTNKVPLNEASNELSENHGSNTDSSDILTNTVCNTESVLTESENCQKQSLENSINSQETLADTVVEDDIPETSKEVTNIEFQSVFVESSLKETEDTILNESVINEPQENQDEFVDTNVSEENIQDSENDNLLVIDQEDPLERKQIPCHVLGRNVTNPSVDIASKGRVPPKPRLGVKIPYRNLTSQIVSKDEIAEEIMERSRLKNAALESAGDVLFARKLTQRLARKLGATESSKSVTNESNTKKKIKNETEEKISIVEESEKEKISDNSDLLAILEGNDNEDMDWHPDNSSEDSSFNEKQFKKVLNESNIGKGDAEDVTAEPKFSSSLVTKTYTRKRKSSGEGGKSTTNVKKPPVSDQKQNVTKVNIDLAPNTYISKSSRIVKKKVIWDPDEAVPMSKFVSKIKVDSKEKLVTPKSAEKKRTKVEKSPIEKKISSKPQIALKDADKTISKKHETPEKKPVDQVLSSSSKSPKSKQNVFKQKRLTEVDKLLMDEGAVNMLYAVKSTEENESSSRTKGKRKSAFSIDNFHQELIDKTNEIKSDLQKNTIKESPKSLRKKDNAIPILKRSEVVGPTGVPIVRKKSKDSPRNSLQSSPYSSGYMYTAEASRIIRRHSSSSFSSVGSHTENVNDENKSVNGSTATASDKTTSGFNKNKSSLSVDGAKTKKVIKLKTDISPLKKRRSEELIDSSGENDQIHNNEFNDCKSISVKRINNYVEISISSVPFNYFNETILNEISTVLSKVAEDDTCSTVVITSSDSSFTKGLDYSSLFSEKEDIRKSLAEKMALSVKNFLNSIASFPKLLVAGIQGDVVGLGVTMLPLFDLVFANDLATFSAPYVNLGCTLEGGRLFSLTNGINNSLVSELLYNARKLNACDALKYGLITRIFSASKFKEELLSAIEIVSKQSLQGIKSVKESLRSTLLLNIGKALDSESDLLIRQWTSEECQQKFKNYCVETG